MNKSDKTKADPPLCTLRCCNGGCATPAPLNRTRWFISSCAAALSSALVGSSAISLAALNGWSGILWYSQRLFFVMNSYEFLLHISTCVQ